MCRRYKGSKLEIHHILPQARGGKDTFDNGIVLCFDCHADAGHYFANHPKGTKFSPEELMKHKKQWFDFVKANGVPMRDDEIKLILADDYKEDRLRPTFVKVITDFKDVEKLKGLEFETIMEQVGSFPFPYSMLIDKVKTFDDFVLFLNGDFFKDYKNNDEDEQNDPQPFKFDYSNANNVFRRYKNLSTCVVKLNLVNNSTEVIEDFKVYWSY